MLKKSKNIHIKMIELTWFFLNIIIIINKVLNL
jgi:hypothetical protein